MGVSPKKRHKWTTSVFRMLGVTNHQRFTVVRLGVTKKRRKIVSAGKNMEKGAIDSLSWGVEIMTATIGNSEDSSINKNGTTISSINFTFWYVSKGVTISNKHLLSCENSLGVYHLTNG